MKEILLIDAFNVIHAASRSARHGPFSDVKRFVYALERHASARESRVTVVFDGTRFEGEFQSSRSLEVLCTKPGEKADTLLERLMREIQPAERIQAVLVSEDNALRAMAMGWGVRVQKPAELLDRLNAAEKPAAPQGGTGRSEPFNNPFRGL